MDTIKKIINKQMLNTYIFNLVISLILVLITILFVNQSDLAKIFFGLAVAYFGLFLSLYSGKASTLKKFYKTLEKEDVSNFVTVENSILLQNCIVSFSFNVPVKMDYAEIKLIRYEPNIFEKTRPGYKGNHKLYIESKDKQILIPLVDEPTAQKIMNFFNTKNPNIQFQQKIEKYERVELSDLENTSVNTRF